MCLTSGHCPPRPLASSLDSSSAPGPQLFGSAQSHPHTQLSIGLLDQGCELPLGCQAISRLHLSGLFVTRGTNGGPLSLPPRFCETSPPGSSPPLRPALGPSSAYALDDRGWLFSRLSHPVASVLPVQPRSPCLVLSSQVQPLAVHVPPTVFENGLLPCWSHTLGSDSFFQHQRVPGPLGALCPSCHLLCP